MDKKEYKEASTQKIGIVLVLAGIAAMLVISITVGAVLAFLDKIDTETKLREGMENE